MIPKDMEKTNTGEIQFDVPQKDSKIIHGYAENGRPLMLHLKGTVICKIWWQVLLVTIYAAAVVSIHNYLEGFRLNFPLSLVTLLGAVLGLLLVFRNNTAYDRYWEGRRMWSLMAQNIRNLTRCIWVGVDVGKEEQTAGEILEKISAINLLVAFADAVKNYLREEYSHQEPNIKDQIRHLPRFGTSKSSKCISRSSSRKSVKSYISSYTDPDNKVKNKSGNKHYNFKAYDFVTPTNIPIEITYYLASYVQSVRVRELCDSYTLIIMNRCICQLVDSLTSLERILRTPIPLAYSVHLHHSLWLYILALPYQLARDLNWFTVPAVAIASFALLGLLCIGWEIENPFGYDENDLPLDEMCRVIRKETHKVISRPMPKPESWLLSSENHPVAHLSPLDAEELATKTVDEILKILAREAKTSFIITADKK